MNDSLEKEFRSGNKVSVVIHGVVYRSLSKAAKEFYDKLGYIFKLWKNMDCL